MARSSNAPRFGEGQEFFLNLYAEVAFDLQVYCDVVGAQKTKLINRALREMIDRDLDENRGFGQRFTELRAQRIAADRGRKQSGVGPLRVLKTPLKSTSSGRARRQGKHDQ